jgi:hypothetical protein
MTVGIGISVAWSLEPAVTRRRVCRGAFALFSLLKRQAELGHGSKSLDRSLSQYSAYPKRSSGVAVASDSYKQRFIESPWTQKVLTLLVCVGVGAIMGDGESPLVITFPFPYSQNWDSNRTAH